MRKFEVVSTFKDQDITIPVRKTKGSAGYDIEAAETVTVYPNKLTIIPTGLKCEFPEDEVLYIHIRSSAAFKRGLRMINSVCVIDSDYYNNPDNEGHILIGILSHNDDIVTIKKGERIAQGIFHKYLTTDDDNVTEERTGGIGSTNK